MLLICDDTAGFERSHQVEEESSEVKIKIVKSTFVGFVPSLKSNSQSKTLLNKDFLF